MPLAINLGAQLSIALCTRSSLTISCPFINILGMVQMNLTVPQAPERSGPVILSAAKDLAAVRQPGHRSTPVLSVILSTAKDLAAGRERPFAALRLTRCDCSN